MVARLALMALRITVLLNLILGILFWTGSSADRLVPVHMGLGILAVLSLWTLGFAQALTKRGSWGLAIGAVVYGIILAASGGAQDELLTGSSHWIIQVIHLFLGVLSLGVGQLLIGRARRVTALAAM